MLFRSLVKAAIFAYLLNPLSLFMKFLVKTTTVILDLNKLKRKLVNHGNKVSFWHLFTKIQDSKTINEASSSTLYFCKSEFFKMKFPSVLAAVQFVHVPTYYLNAFESLTFQCFPQVD